MKLGPAEESLILGRWLVSESGGPVQAIDRLARRLQRLQPKGSLEPLMGILNDVAVAGASRNLSERQREALAEITRLYRLA
jgi:hypothetical protein